jgi:alkylhydroperoxidase family enzyme
VSATGPRLAPLPPDEWSEEAIAAVRAAFGDAYVDGLLAAAEDAPPVQNVIGTLVRHPALTGPFLVYNAVLLRAPTLEPRWRELMILRVAWRTRSEYEWLQHVRIARAVGLTDAEIEAVAAGADAGWAPFERDLLTATDELLDGYRIADATWERLAVPLDERQLVELTFVVGTYTGLAMAFNSFGIELDPELRTLGAPPLPDEEHHG